MKRTALLFLAVCSLIVSSAFAQSGLSGTQKIGPGATYPTLTGAIKALITNGVKGPVVLELQANYTSSTETFPIKVPLLSGVSETNTLTIRPAANATGLVIQSPPMTFSPVIRLDSAAYTIIDGRPGGIGTQSQLSIVSDQQTYSAIELIDNCTHNTIRYLDLSAYLMNPDNGVINMTAADYRTGNTWNSIENCAVHEMQGNYKYAFKGIYSVAGKNAWNRYNTVKDCNFYNIHGQVIFLDANNSDWRITNNNFYATTANEFANYAIYIPEATGSGYVITDNSIGGSGPGCSGQKVSVGLFNGIYVKSAATGFNYILRNKIANISVTADETIYYPFIGIYVTGRNFNCSNNTIGEIENTGMDIPISTITQSVSAGIFAEQIDSCIVSGNKIGGIHGTQKNAALITQLYGIILKVNAYSEVTKNIIGSPVVENSLSLNEDGRVELVGIKSSNNSRTGLNIVNENFVSHLRGSGAGIHLFGGVKHINNNTVTHLFAGGISNEGSLAGIKATDSYYLNAPAGNTVSGNTVHSINVRRGTSVLAYGINLYYPWNTVVERNLVHSVWCDSTAYNNSSYGICLEKSNNVVVKNNLVRMGLDQNGSNIPGVMNIWGIRVEGRGASVMNNSVFVGGHGNASSSALNITSDSLVNVNNNILVNTRTIDLVNGIARGSGTAMSCSAGTVSNYNCYYSPQSPDSWVVRFAGISYSDIRALRKKTGIDSNSFVYPPGFKNATGDASTVDLHIVGPSPVKGAGSYDNSITEDFDGDKRNFSSPDIGADAGNYPYQDGDAPMLTHEAFKGQAIKSDYIYKVRIVDNVGGIDTTAANAPRMWLRKGYPQKGDWFSVAGTKLEGNVNESIWGFHPDLSKAGTTFAPGDSLDYYFVAQDKGPVINVGYSNIDSTKHTDVKTQLTAPLNPLRLLVYGFFPDTVYIGEGKQYTSLTNEGGFFQATASNVFDSTKANVYAIITSDLEEDGTYPMKVLYNTSCRINMVTNTPVLKTIRKVGGFWEQYPLVTLSGVNNLVIDGRVGDTGRYLRFECVNKLTDLEMSAMQVDGNNSNLELTHLEFASNNTKTKGLWPGTLTCTGKFKNTRINNSLFTYIASQNVTAPDGSPKVLPAVAIYLSGDMDSVIIQDNDISNFLLNGILMSNNNLANGRLRIEGNHFYYNAPVYNTLSPVVIDAGSFHAMKVINNYIGGSAPYCGGAKWTITTSSARDREETGYYFTGMHLYGADSLSVQGNVFAGVQTPLYTSSYFKALNAGGTYVNIGNEKPNIIGSLNGDTSIYGGTNGGITVTSDNGLVQNNIMSGVYTNGEMYAIKASGKNEIIDANQVIGLKGINGNIFDISVTNGAIVTANLIKDCTFENTKGSAYGTAIRTSQNNMTRLPPTALIVERNSISNLQCNTATASNVAFMGIYATYAAATIRNNQISMHTGSAGSIVVTGLNVYTTYTRTDKTSNRIFYNSIYLSGKSQNTENSYGIYLDDVNIQQQLRNNIVYNNRSGGTGNHLAIGTKTAFAANADNNLYITSTANVVNKYKTNDAGTIEQWRSLTATDAASYATTTAVVPVDSLFRNATIGDLDINTSSTMSWLVNGKGMPIEGIYNDHSDSAHVRSTAINTGATDIGSDEFNTATPPPGLTVTGSHTPGGTEQMLYNGRVIASITWSNTGTLPTLNTPLFYSGEWPNDATNNGTITTARYMNGYWVISATGGSGYAYSLTLSYDSSMLGKITDAASMVLNKREPGTNGSWQILTPSVVDTVAKTVTVYNQSSFSEFTLTDSLATATKPVLLADLSISSKNASLQTRQRASFKFPFTVKNIGQGYALPHKIRLYLSTNNVLTADDSLLATININKLAAGDSIVIDTLNLSLGCALQTGNYYIVAQADAENVVPESDKSNNVFQVNAYLLPAADIALSSTKTTVCVGEQITFNASGASTFTFTGEGVANVTKTSFNVNTLIPGDYTYKATGVANGCTLEAQANISVNAGPVVTASSSAENICNGQTVTLTGAGAANYIWRSEDGAYTGQSYKAAYTGTGGHQYLLTGIDQNGCSGAATTSFIVDGSGVPSVSIDYSGCPGRVLTFQASPVNGGENPTYAWYVNDVYKAAGATYILNDAYNSQEVYVVMNANNACLTNSEAVSAISKINCTITAVPVIDGMEDYSIYPNPGPGLFYVHVKLNTAKTVKIVVGDNKGNVIKMIPAAMKSGDVKIELDLSGQPAGVYYIQSTIGTKTFTRKVVKI